MKNTFWYLFLLEMEINCFSTKKKNGSNFNIGTTSFITIENKASDTVLGKGYKSL